ncbi:MAG: hypothetical protein QJR12_16860 [Mycobacterium sp.]|uniref:hypothetical protein n=1 Tax=Mycobacterium sp. TaxID=1785 RepID=UPI00262D167B|nr:hypothetical protein [Mycobacterium sp.]MDI3315878.1 hypothetical protein [Mycobacterium sp.]
MATAYQYVGPGERDYPDWGLRVKPGDVVYLDGRPPGDGRWQQHQTPDAPATATAATEPAPAETRRPNLAASAEAWKAYAIAQGLPEDVVAKATRKAIIDHFTGAAALPVEQQEE